MTTIAASASFNPEVLARLVSSGFANVPILFGSGAVAPDFTSPYGADYVGLSVKIPYTSVPNTWSDVSDGSPLTPVAFQIGNAAGNSTTPESETVQRSGIAMDMTTWAKSNPLDPYSELRKQMLLGWAQRMENKLITAACRNTGNEWDAYTVDITSTADPLLNHDAVVDAMATLGSEGFNDSFILGVVHSHVIGTLWKRKDATGKPWLLSFGEMTPTGAQIFRLMPLGIPIYVSDLVPLSNGKYTSIFCRRNSLALYMNPNLSARSVQAPLTDSQVDALNCYYASHRYVRLQNRAKPGVALVISN